MLMKVLLAPVMGPISGVVWIAEKIQERTNTEFDAQENLHKRLLSLQLAFDIGEISEEEFEIQEEEILLKIQALEEEARLEAQSEEEEYYQQQPQFTLEVAEVEEDKHLVLLP
ncbi:gas vesicle protein GvpG [Sphaerospermopsis aphanizomenoides BCCUSP55]|uniref:gas vesicle protein GvpG n=1 Tax=Sphaerospermopsis aphanizomenoides TaxID=459663 RepID=UPI00190896CB|nr:gas vesicle protein GvpG [Sphaerospermopsis aphanizomenoides]MBK1989404.1 gas vesicle protein GvpG [Sphaerospermopsis aphanizomenoides BCCUSP55]